MGSKQLDMAVFGNIDGLKDAIINANAGDKLYLSSQFFRPQDIDKTLKKMGYNCGDPDFLGRGLVVRSYTKDKNKTVKVYSDGLTFDLFLTFSEPCNYFIDF